MCMDIELSQLSRIWFLLMSSVVVDGVKSDSYVKSHSCQMW